MSAQEWKPTRLARFNETRREAIKDFYDEIHKSEIRHSGQGLPNIRPKQNEKISVPPVCRLVSMSNSQAYPSVVIHKSTSVIIGRNKDCDVVLDDPHISG